MVPDERSSKEIHGGATTTAATGTVRAAVQCFLEFAFERQAKNQQLYS
jgi:hypothetical protein